MYYDIKSLNSYLFFTQKYVCKSIKFRELLSFKMSFSVTVPIQIKDKNVFKT